MRTRIVAISLGGTTISACVAITDGTVLRELQFPTAMQDGPDPAIGRLRQFIIAAIAEEPIAGIAIACGCPIRPDDGVILEAKPLASWTGINLKTTFAEFGVPVWTLNDADAGALAELYYGTAAGVTELLFLTFGTGMGSGIVNDGQLVQGVSRCAGEVAHVPLPCRPHWVVAEEPDGLTTFEGVCSGLGIARLCDAAVAGGRFPSTVLRAGMSARDVFAAAAAGDDAASAIVRTVGEALGLGVRTLVTILNPAAVVLGGIFVRQEALLRPYVTAALEQLAALNRTAAKAVRVYASSLGERISFLQAVAAGRYYSEMAA